MRGFIVEPNGSAGVNRQTSIETDDHFAVMFEQMPVGVALYDAQTFCLLAANPLFFQFLDPPWRGNPQAIGHSPMSWLPEAEEQGVMEIFRVVAETGVPYRSGIYMFPAFERGLTYWSWTLSPVRDQDGEVGRLLQTLIEITEQVEAQQRREAINVPLQTANRSVETERQRLEVVEAVASSVRISLDPKRISMAASKAILDTFKTRHVFIHTADPAQQALRLLHIYPALENRSMTDLLKYVPYTSPFLMARAHMQRDPIVVADISEALTQGIISGESPLANYTAMNSYVCVPLWFGEQFEGTLTATFIEAIAIDGPEVQTLLACSTHIAAALANARLHADVENERARLRSILDQLPEGILITEAANGRVNYANTAAAAILGLPVKTLINTSLHQNAQAIVSHKGTLQVVLPWNFAVIRALSGETISSQETSMIRPDGKNVTILSSSAPVRSQWGTITGAVIVFQDITAQKSLEQQKNEFLSFASHELRTPVTAIQGFAEILQLQIESGKQPGPQSLRALAIINEQSQTLTRLVDEMLDLTRIDNMQLMLHRSRCDLVDILRSAIETQASTTKKHQLRLVLDGLAGADKVEAFVDKNRCTQIVGNLLSNAIKYSPEGGAIEIGLYYFSPARTEVVIWVKDHGIGIPESETTNIFKRFHRVQDIDPAISGLGIGLYLVKELAALHGGRIWVESVEGRGSTFSVQLPLNLNH